jgi:rubrerythrin
MMSVLFSGNEIVDIAVKIEENGRKFYLAAADRAGDDNLAQVLRKLADDEVDHRDTFQALYKAEEDYGLLPGYSEEADAYIKAMASAQVFAPGKGVAEIAKGAKDVFEVLTLAMGAEKDSILYYTEMARWVQPKDKDVINGVVAEEKTHLKTLMQLYDSLKDGCCS